ncbi:MAG: hypothetical protein OEL76_06800 [Siculibacillus sp.]|nr:hypothetical protein [Siculibacillus sp.]
MFLGERGSEEQRRTPSHGVSRASLPPLARPPAPPRTAAAARPARPHAPPSSAGPPDEARPWRRLAERLGVDFLDRIVPDAVAGPPPDPEVFRRAHAVLIGEGDRSILVGAPHPEEIAAIETFLRCHPEERRRLAIATPREIRRALVERHSAGLVRRAVRAILDRDPVASAANAVSHFQLAAILLVLAAWLAAVLDLSHALLALWTTEVASGI